MDTSHCPKKWQYMDNKNYGLVTKDRGKGKEVHVDRKEDGEMTSCRSNMNQNFKKKK